MNSEVGMRKAEKIGVRQKAKGASLKVKLRR
jgi:hypothetical protein